MAEHIWIVRDPRGEVVGISAHGREAALRDARECDRWQARHERALNAFFEYQGWRVQREPLTPAPVVPVVTEAMVSKAYDAGLEWYKLYHEEPVEVAERETKDYLRAVLTAALTAASEVPVMPEAITDADGAPVLVYMVLDQHNTPVAHSQDKDDADFAASQLANDEQQLRVIRVCLLPADSHQSVPSDYSAPVVPVMAEAMVTQYTLGDLDDRDTMHRAIRVEYAGSGRWAVRRLGMSLGTDGEWDYEPQPSSRDDAWIAAFRFPNAQAALHAASEVRG